MADADRIVRVQVTVGEIDAMATVVSEYFRMLDYREVVLKRDEADRLVAVLQKLKAAAHRPGLAVLPGGKS